ncbi:peptidoglycan-associated lipoprotein Pal [Desulforhopalus vacuolatus]|uniref:peptidoglycan-associated lipoprotein Pal n=1 Tax=Desulforhopalus vacuolatus TaxID=40414 RepID=UPI0019658C10|nr:peptidoglycan-associated lipoprotein Pal [Desulforhopalus vacuolatus]MBM9519441.1 peptidoglycan-associated lipoprotein Pal [Desulforhopalus vacuolatus]
MKNSIFNTILVTLSVSLLLLLGGCAKTIVPPTDTSAMATGSDLEYPESHNTGTMGEAGFSEDNLPLEGSLDDNSHSFNDTDIMNMPEAFRREHGRSSEGFLPVYFEFDQFRLSPEMMVVIEQNAAYMQSNPAINLILEGNCDERGTAEYNLALAERRAINVKRYLTNTGIPENHIRTISYGEERPLFLGHDEKAYKYNRRVDFIAE